MMRFLLATIVFLQSFSLASDPRPIIGLKINAIRKSHGLEELTPNETLRLAAQSQSDWMASKGVMEHLREEATNYDEFKICSYHPVNRVINSGYFSFEEIFRVRANLDGSTTVLAQPAANENVGEIIAKGVGPGSPDVYDPKVMIKGWMNSPGHKKQILTSGYKEFGVGFTSPRYGETYWCVVFANPIEKEKRDVCFSR